MRRKSPNRVSTDVMDKPLQPGRCYRLDVVMSVEHVFPSDGSSDIADFYVRDAIAKLLGPHSERIKVPIGANAIRLRLTAQIDRWEW